MSNGLSKAIDAHHSFPFTLDFRSEVRPRMTRRRNYYSTSTRVPTHFLSAMRACRIDSAMSSRLLFARLCEPSFALQTCHRRVAAG